MIFRAIPSYPDYVASSDGDVISLKRGRRLKMRTQVNADGYKRCNVSMNGVVEKVSIHILVCEAFHGPCPPGKQCRHLNGSRQDNRQGNLRWGTPAENASDRSSHGFWKPLGGERHPGAKISDEEVAELIRKHASGVRQTELTKEYGLSPAQVCRIVNGQRRNRQAIAS